jgi:hypothetical protein
MVLALVEQGADVTVIHTRVREDSLIDPSEVWKALACRSFFVVPDGERSRCRVAKCAVQFRTPIYARWVAESLHLGERLHAECPFDLVYSRSLPFCAHIAGYWISRNLRRPWIANINDPWDLHCFPGRFHSGMSPIRVFASNYWMKRTLKTADALTFPCHRLAIFTARTGLSLSGIETIPHIGWPRSRAEDPSEFCLLHAGKLGVEDITGRSSRSLLAGFRRFLDQVPSADGKARLELVGPADPETARLITTLRLETAVSQTGRVSYEESLARIGAASACVLIEGDMREGIYLPSKLADYIVARKPVLALSPSVGTVEDLSTDPAVFRLERADEKGIAGTILHLYKAHSDGRLDQFRPSEGLVKAFSADAVAQRFLGLARRVVNARGAPVPKSAR